MTATAMSTCATRCRTYLASTANLLKTNGWKAGGDYDEGSANFEAMREWNRSEIYRKTIGYFADQLVGR